jgi:hypothetical protein
MGCSIGPLIIRENIITTKPSSDFKTSKGGAVLSDDIPETPVSGEERVIDCGAIGVIRWEVSQSMWEYLGALPDEDRERVIDIATEQIHAQCHGICEYVARFVARRATAGSTSSEEKVPGDTFPESWMHD